MTCTDRFDKHYWCFDESTHFDYSVRCPIPTPNQPVRNRSSELFTLMGGTAHPAPAEHILANLRGCAHLINNHPRGACRPWQLEQHRDNVIGVHYHCCALGQVHSPSLSIVHIWWP